MLKIAILALSLASAIGWLVLANTGQSHLILKLVGAIIVSYGVFVAVLLATAAHIRADATKPDKRGGHSALQRQ